jgi:hypothetical protein
MGDRGQDANWNPRMRNQGNPHARVDTRQPDRSADVAPAQGKSVPPPRYLGARYRLGSPIRPSSIVFDNGFLDKIKPRKATAGDYLALTKWQMTLQIAEQVRVDLEEACKAYRHFLQGGGLPRTFSYEAYVYNDESGATTLANAMQDIQDGAEIIYRANSSVKAFSLTGDQIPCGSNTLFPYPATENWQKAIGGHVIWLSGDCKVAERGTETWFVLDLVLHAEDRYNFNPGAKDIATGIPDSDNGIFEITGLAKQYTQTAELKRRIEWKYGTLETGGNSTASIPWR